MRTNYAPFVVCATAALAAVTLSPSPASAATPSFQGLGHLPGYDWTVARAVSDDGSVVVGYARSSDGSEVEAFRWTRAEGMQELGFLPGFSDSYATGVSGDGSTIVGGSNSRAFRWTSEGMDSLRFPIFNRSLETPDAGIAISFDGSTIVGARGAVAFRWTSAGGLERFAFPSGVTTSSANAISADGSVFVGSYSTASEHGAFRWTSDDGFQNLGLPPGEYNPEAFAVSADGSVVVGWNGSQGFRWKSAEGTHLLGPASDYSYATGVSGDGSIIVGFLYADPFLWDATRGRRSLQQVLVGDYGLDLTGWTLQSAYAISADGRTIVGSGTHLGRTEAWIATIPEPSSLALLGLGGILLYFLRRRQRSRKG
jgi:probable HAF family extracellular repeat protein